MSSLKHIEIKKYKDLDVNRQLIYENTTENLIFYNSAQGQIENDIVTVGIDEAGRGCILGYMLICGLYVRENREDILLELGCRDSKALSSTKRKNIFKLICDHPDIGFFVKAISPAFISESTLKANKYNLNTMSIDTAAELVRLISAKSIKSICADTVGSSEKYSQFLSFRFPKSSVFVCPKADSKYAQVSGASIVAKVIRDHLLENWVFIEEIRNRDFGSGYTSDETTLKWLRNVCSRNIGFPNIVRFNWSTSDKILKEEGIEIIWKSVRKTLPKVIKRAKL